METEQENNGMVGPRSRKKAKTKKLLGYSGNVCIIAEIVD